VTRYFADLGACFVALRFSQVTEFDSAPLGARERPLSKLKCAIPSVPDIHLMPACPKCSAQMKLVRVMPADKGLEDRTFQCLKCHHVDTWVFKII
jgi:hypothetical protein